MDAPDPAIHQPVHPDSTRITTESKRPGSQEVDGSIPFSSTIPVNNLTLRISPLHRQFGILCGRRGFERLAQPPMSG